VFIIGQQEINDFLKSDKTNWFQSKEIAKATDTEIASVTQCLKIMRNRNEIMFKEIRIVSLNRPIFMYRFKR